MYTSASEFIHSLQSSRLILQTDRCSCPLILQLARVSSRLVRYLYTKESGYFKIKNILKIELGSLSVPFSLLFFIQKSSQTIPTFLMFNILSYFKSVSKGLFHIVSNYILSLQNSIRS